MLAYLLRRLLLLELGSYAFLCGLLLAGRLIDWLGAMIFVAILFFGSRVLFVGLTFVISALNNSPAAEQKRWLLATLHMVLGEYFALLALIAVLLPFERWLFGADKLKKLAPGETPILLIHGYFCNRGIWWWLRNQLEVKNYCVATLNLEPVYTHIDNYVEQVKQRIDEIREVTGAAQVVLIGHSMGGLVARAYLRQHGAQHVARLITLGTPHRGTRLAYVGPGDNARDMEPSSPWLAALNEAPATGLPPITSIYSEGDNLVMPQTNQRLEGAKNLPLTALGHLTLPFSEEVSKLVLAELAAAPSMPTSPEAQVIST